MDLYAVFVFLVRRMLKTFSVFVGFMLICWDAQPFGFASLHCFVQKVVSYFDSFPSARSSDILYDCYCCFVVDLHCRLPCGDGSSLHRVWKPDCERGSLGCGDVFCLAGDLGDNGLLWCEPF